MRPKLASNPFLDKLRYKKVGADEFFVKDVRGISYINWQSRQGYYVAELNYNKYPLKNSLTQYIDAEGNIKLLSL